MHNEATQLRATLARLQEQLASLGPSMGAVNPEVRAQLETALADIHALLDDGGLDDGGTPSAEADAAQAGAAQGGAEQPGSSEAESIVERLTAAERHFEQSHPTLAGIVGSIISALSRMGI